MGLLAIVPGLPFFPFMVLAGLCGVTAWALLRRVESPTARERPGGLLGALVGPSEPPSDLYEGGGTGPPRGLVELVALELSDSLAARLGAGGDGLADRVPGPLRERLFHELGVALPAVVVRSPAATAPADGYRILIKEVPLAEVTLPPDRVVAFSPSSRLVAAGLPAEPVDWIGLEHGLSLVPAAEAGRLRDLDVGVVEGADIVALHLEAVLRRYAHEFVGIQETRALLDALESTHPQLVSELVPRPVTVSLLADVLRRLVEERINVRHLADILPALATWSKTEKDPVLLTEYCRMALRRQITHRFADASGALSAVVVAPEIEQTLSESIRRSEAGSYLALEPALGQEILAAARTACQPCLDAGQPPVLLTSMETRRFLRKLLEVELPDAIVLSYQELAPDLSIEPVGRLSL
jgi:type III secretion protein V